MQLWTWQRRVDASRWEVSISSCYHLKVLRRREGLRPNCKRVCKCKCKCKARPGARQGETDPSLRILSRVDLESYRNSAGIRWCVRWCTEQHKGDDDWIDRHLAGMRLASERWKPSRRILEKA